MEVDAENFTVAQLKQWLSNLGQPTSGSKSAMVSRLNGVPPEIRNEWLAAGGNMTQNVCEEQQQDDEIDGQDAQLDDREQCSSEGFEGFEVQSQESNAGKQEGKNDRKIETPQMTRNDTSSKEQTNEEEIQMIENEEIEQTGDDYNAIKNKNENESSIDTNNLKFLKKENELLQREKQLLTKEIEIMNKEANILKTTTLQASIERPSLNATHFELAKDFLPNFDGTQHFNIWVEQFLSIRNSFDLHENLLRALLIKKLTGKAQTWLFSKPKFSTKTVDMLLAEMQDYFGNRESKVVLRKKFEIRKWKVSESFAKYYNDKVVASHNLNMDTDELIDSVIEGIPDETLKRQARLQCFSSESQLLQAFSNMQRFKYPIKVNISEGEMIRCYNCNSLGHSAIECRKPKRDTNACYVCGELGHRVADCNQHKVKNNAS